MKRLLVGSLMSCMLLGQLFAANATEGSESIFSKYFQGYKTGKISSEELRKNIWNNELRSKLRRRYLIGGLSGALAGLAVAKFRNDNRGESRQLQPRDALWALGGYVLGSRIGGIVDITKKNIIGDHDNMLGGASKGAILGAVVAGALHMLCGGGYSQQGVLSLGVGTVLGAFWGTDNETISGDERAECPSKEWSALLDEEEASSNGSTETAYKFYGIYGDTQADYMNGRANTYAAALFPERMLFASVPRSRWA
jgi:hypothetical protein